MKLIGYRWRTLYRSHPADWTEALLADASADELEALCRLMGIAHSGTKAHRIARLLQAAHVRLVMAAWGEATDHAAAHALADRLMKQMKAKDLKPLCTIADVPTWLGKRGMIIGLIQWRTECRRRGQQFDTDLRTAPCTIQHQMF